MAREEFIKKIAPYIIKYATQYNILCPSAVIAQAVLESGGGTSELAVNAHNYFGLKYRTGRCPTACGVYYKDGAEQNADGTYTTSAMQWMKFSNMDKGVRGYFDFINTSNYSKCKNISNPQTYLENIKAAGYATSLKYVENLMKVISTYNLTQYDSKNNKEENMGYTNSSLVSYTKISPNKTSPRNHKIDTITIHCVVGQVTVERLGEIFAPTSRQASSNYGIGKDGKIGMYVEEKDRSWCSSNKTNDHRAITIEVASDTTHPYAVTNEALNSLIKLCADICKRNNIKKLIWSTNKNDRVNHKNGCNMTVHRDFANKSCPGQYLYDKHGYIADEVNKLLGSYVQSTNINTNTPVAKTYVVVKGDTLSKIGEKTGIKWKTIANLNGIKFPYTIRTGQVLKLTNSISNNTITSTSNSYQKYIYNNIDYSPVFNPIYYTNKYPDLKKTFGTNSISLWNHFKDYGMKEGRQASEDFDVNVYKNRYMDLQKAFGNNTSKYYEHYCKYGIKEGRNAI